MQNEKDIKETETYIFVRRSRMFEELNVCVYLFILVALRSFE